jgi:hypothetical protein
MELVVVLGLRVFLLEKRLCSQSGHNPQQTQHLQLWEVWMPTSKFARQKKRAFTTLISSNAYMSRHQRVIGCRLPILWSQTPCKTPQEKKKREKKVNLEVFRKKKTPP